MGRGEEKGSEIILEQQMKGSDYTGEINTTWKARTSLGSILKTSIVLGRYEGERGGNCGPPENTMFQLSLECHSHLELVTFHNLVFPVHKLGHVPAHANISTCEPLPSLGRQESQRVSRKFRFIGEPYKLSTKY